MKLITKLQATPSRAIGLMNVLDGRDWTTQETLENLMSPPALSMWRAVKSSKTKATADDEDTGPDKPPPAIMATAESLVELGLIEEKGRTKKKLRLSCNRPRDLDGHRNLFANYLLAHELTDKTNQLARLIAWLMSLQVTDLPQSHSALKTRLQQSNLDLGEFTMNTDSRWDTLMYWVRFLGLVWQTEDSLCVGIVPDPTALLRRNLDHLVPPGEEVQIKEFRARLGTLAPVLDGGSVRDAVMKETGQSTDRLSSSLSLSLMRLMAKGVLRVWCPDDQRSDAFLLMTNERDTKVAFVARRTGG